MEVMYISEKSHQQQQCGGWAAVGLGGDRVGEGLMHMGSGESRSKEQ